MTPSRKYLNWLKKRIKEVNANKPFSKDQNHLTSKGGQITAFNQVYNYINTHRLEFEKEFLQEEK